MSASGKPLMSSYSDPAVAQAEAELKQAQKQLAWEMTKAAADVAGIVDPSPISDGVSAAMSLADGDLVGAGLSLISMVPLLGDALAKTAKGARAHKAIKEATKMVAAAVGKLKAVQKAAAGIAKAKHAAYLGKRYVKGGVKAILRCPKMAPHVKAAAGFMGVNRVVAARLLELAKVHNVKIRMRPVNKDSAKWINKGHPPKPVYIKAKTISELDELIGAPKNARGQVGYFAPTVPDIALRQTKPELYAKLEMRYKQRVMEYKHEMTAMKQLQKEGKVVVKNGVIIDKKSGKAYAGDNDIYSITKADGTPLTEEEKAKVIKDLCDPPVNAQHADLVSWDPNGIKKDQAIKDEIIEHHTYHESLAEFSPDGFSTSREKARVIEL